MLPEDPILLPEVVDQVFLVAIHPASDRQYEELQRRGHRLRVPAGAWERFRPRRLFRTLRGDERDRVDRPRSLPVVTKNVESLSAS